MTASYMYTYQIRAKEHDVGGIRCGTEAKEEGLALDRGTKVKISSFFFFFHRGGRNELRSSTSNTSFYVFPWSSEIPWNRIVPRFENDVFLLTMEILDVVRTT